MKPKGKFNKNTKFYKNSTFFFENALSFVDAPGEWYHDRHAGVVYLATMNTDPNRQIVTIPRTETLISICGNSDKPVLNLTFEGITFECSNWTSPSEEGLNITQFVQPDGVKRSWENSDYPTGIIRVVHARRLAFRNNIIRNAGAHGIQFFANVDDSDIEGNEIYHIAANGIEIDSHGKRNPSADQQSTGVAIWNNNISKCGRDYTNGGGIFAHNVRAMIIEHNFIWDMPYSGIQIGNQPGEGFDDIGCDDNRVRYNHVHHCMQLHDDGGGIYTLGGIQEGSVISENYIHDIKKSKWAGNYLIDLIYLDNRTTKILVKDNVVNGGQAAERNGSKGNILQNNIQSNPDVEKSAGVRPGYDPRAK